MWLLPVRPDHVGCSAYRKQSEPQRRRNRCGHVRQYLSMRHLSAHSRRHQAGIPVRLKPPQKGAVMGLERLLKPTKDKAEGLLAGVSRRAFLVTSAAAGGGLLVGFYLPQRIIAEAATPDADVFGPNAFVRV